MLWKANEKSTQEENKSPNKRTDRDNWFGNICFTCGSIESGFYAMLIKNDDWAWCGSLRNPGKGNLPCEIQELSGGSDPEKITTWEVGEHLVTEWRGWSKMSKSRGSCCHSLAAGFCQSDLSCTRT